MKKIINVSSLLVVLVGIIMFSGGIGGIVFTYKSVVRENIVTPKDASIPNTLVRGPLTLKAQADVIREHTLKTTKGKTYSEMPQQIPKLDQYGKSILNEKGEAVMVPNDARNIWVTATTLMTALNLGILTYMFSGLALFLGLAFIWSGIIFRTLKKRGQ